MRLPTFFYRGAIDDEAVYTVVANEMVHGGRPYIDAVERKPPLLFWTYAAVIRIGGEYNWTALHAAAALWTLGTAAGLYAAGRTLFGDEAGALAAILYVVFEPWGTWRNYAWNGESLMNLPLAWAWAIAFRRSRSAWRPDLAAAGALVAAAFLLKQPAGIAIIALAIYVALPAYRSERRLGLPDSAAQFVVLAAGFAAGILAAAGVLRREGILWPAIYWTILDHDVPHIFWMHGAVQTCGFAAACLPLLVGGAVTLRRWPGRPHAGAAERQAIAAFVAVSAIGAAASGRFYSHYYIQMILPLALLAAPFFSSAAGAGRHGRMWRWSWLAASAIVFTGAGAAGILASPPANGAGRYVDARSAASDRIFVWGQAPQIYLQARRRPACRYITTFPLTGFVFGETLHGLDTRARINPQAWPNLQADFAAHPPRYIVDVRNNAAAQYPIREFPILAAWIARHCGPPARVAEGDVYACN